MLTQKAMHEDLIKFKVFVNFVNFTCMIFWDQNVLIPPNQVPPFELHILKWLKDYLICSFILVSSEDLGSILCQNCCRYIEKYSPYSVAIINWFIYFASDKNNLVDARNSCLKIGLIRYDQICFQSKKCFKCCPYIKRYFPYFVGIISWFKYFVSDKK